MSVDVVFFGFFRNFLLRSVFINSPVDPARSFSFVLEHCAIKSHISKAYLVLSQFLLSSLVPFPLTLGLLGRKVSFAVGSG